MQYVSSRNENIGKFTSFFWKLISLLAIVSTDHLLQEKNHSKDVKSTGVSWNLGNLGKFKIISYQPPLGYIKNKDMPFYWMPHAAFYGQFSAWTTLHYKKKRPSIKPSCLLNVRGITANLPIFNFTINNSPRNPNKLHFYEIGHVADKYSLLLQCFPQCFYKLFEQSQSSHKISHL